MERIWTRSHQIGEAKLAETALSVVVDWCTAVLRIGFLEPISGFRTQHLYARTYDRQLELYTLNRTGTTRGTHTTSAFSSGRLYLNPELAASSLLSSLEMSDTKVNEP